METFAAFAFLYGYFCCICLCLRILLLHLPLSHDSLNRAACPHINLFVTDLFVCPFACLLFKALHASQRSAVLSAQTVNFVHHISWGAYDS